MTIFLGSEGYVELVRTESLQEYSSQVNAADVNTTRNRFSFDFPDGMLITGDRIEFKALDGGNLTFLPASAWNVGEQQPDGDFYVNVDTLGGIRLYQEFSAAVNGEQSGAIQLEEPGRDIPITVRPVTSSARCLAKVTSYEFNTAREAVDVSELSDQFRKQYSQLISGSGSFNCFFSYDKCLCEATNQPTEEAVYLHQLCIRQQLGAKFRAKLYVSCGSKAVWYEFDALVTNAAITVEPAALIRSSINFVTTGEISLKVKAIDQGYLLQDPDDAFILLDQDIASKLELDLD